MGLPESFESEGKDREHMKLPLNQTELLKKISEVNTNIVVVLSAGSVVEMQWTDYCKGLVLSGLGGQAQAEAVLKVLTGQVNPGGKLSETYPYVYEDVPVIEYWQKKPYKSEYREGIYVGYRYYESAGIEVKFPFGYGLSYTQFTYSNLIVTKKGVMITVENTGGREGSEVIQLYVRKKSKNLFSPIKELKGFKKIFLNAGENQKVKIGFDDKTFRHFDEKKGVWQTESGIWNIMIGSSVRDIELRSEVFINFSKGNITEIKQLNKKGELEKYTTTEESEKVLNLSSYYSANIKNVADDEFKELMMYTDVYKTQNKGDSLEINDPLSDLVKARSRIARLTGKAIKKCKERSERKNPPDLNILFIYNIPFRGIAKLMNGNISMEMTEAILEIVNGYFCKGIKDFIKGAILNRKNKKQYYKGGLYEEK